MMNQISYSQPLAPNYDHVLISSKTQSVPRWTGAETRIKEALNHTLGLTLSTPGLVSFELI